MRNTNQFDVPRLRAQINAATFYQRELPGLRVKTPPRWQDGGLCPLHPDKRPGSFKIHPGTGCFRCFACDAHGGDVFAFAMQRYGLLFPDAVRYVCNCVGVRA